MSFGIITINFEDPDYKLLKTSDALYEYVKNKRNRLVAK